MVDSKVPGNMCKSWASINQIKYVYNVHRNLRKDSIKKKAY